MDPLVSVVMSIYKPDVAYLEEQLRSITDQDYSNMEVVIYNDYPSDENREGFIAGILGDVPFRYIHGSINLGYVKAFEHLVKMAKGDYICFCDQDDIWMNDRVSRAVEIMRGGTSFAFVIAPSLTVRDVLLTRVTSNLIQMILRCSGGRETILRFVLLFHATLSAWLRWLNRKLRKLQYLFLETWVMTDGWLLLPAKWGSART